jgi:hydroxyacylglutathione hydrolase
VKATRRPEGVSLHPITYDYYKDTFRYDIASRPVQLSSLITRLMVFGSRSSEAEKSGSCYSGHGWVIGGPLMGAMTAILLCIAAILSVPLVLAVLIIRTVSRFAPAQTGYVSPDFLAINDKFVAIFILKSGDDLICFDAGNKIKSVEKGFADLGLDPLKVKAIFLTHSDRDHVNGLPLFRNAVVYLPEKEEPLVTGAAKRHLIFLRRVNKLPVEKYGLIKDSETVTVGKSTIKAILTPGHTSGSTSYLVNGTYLVVGDLAITKNGKLVGMPKPPSEQPKLIEESLKQVENIKGIQYIATAHGGVVKKQVVRGA